MHHKFSMASFRPLMGESQGSSNPWFLVTYTTQRPTNLVDAFDPCKVCECYSLHFSCSAISANFIHTTESVASANLWWSINKNQIENVNPPNFGYGSWSLYPIHESSQLCSLLSVGVVDEIWTHSFNLLWRCVFMVFVLWFSPNQIWCPVEEK